MPEMPASGEPAAGVAEPDGLPWGPQPAYMVAVDQLTAHPGNVREDLGLTPQFLASVAETGVRIPLLVTPHDDGGFLVIEGHRRLAAAVQAGLAEVPCVLGADRADDQAGQFLDMVIANSDGHRRNGVGGEFAFDDAKLWYYEALTLADAEDPARAEHAAAVAVSLYQAVPARARSYGCEALARVQLARARLMGGNLDDAADALGGMLSLDPQLRIGSLSEYLETCRELLRTPAYRSPAGPATRRLQRSQRRPGAAWRAMTIQHETARPAVDFPAVAEAAMQDAARRSGLNARGARLIRLFATAVYHLPAADAVARIALVTSPESVARLDTSVQVTRWLTRIGFPSVEPLPVEQPVTGNGCVVTFWRYLRQDGPRPASADLGRLLRRLHELGPPPVALPAYQPLVSARRTIAASRAVDEEERVWLGERCQQLVDAYGQLRFRLQAGMIHGDAYRGNLLRDGQRAVLADWDAVSIGPREVDLIPTLQATRFGLPDDQRDAFITAYGRDIRSWDGYLVLRDIRELSTLTALLRDGHMDPAAQRELRIRLNSLRTGDNQEWTPF